MTLQSSAGCPQCSGILGAPGHYQLFGDLYRLHPLSQQPVHASQLGGGETDGDPLVGSRSSQRINGLKSLLFPPLDYRGLCTRWPSGPEELDLLLKSPRRAAVTPGTRPRSDALLCGGGRNRFLFTFVDAI